MKHKMRFLIPACCVTVIVALIAANIDNYEKPIDATVNPANGDIAVGYLNNKFGCFVVECFDSNGDFLFSKSYKGSNGTLYMQYAENQLMVYVSVQKQLYVYSRDGENISKYYDEASKQLFMADQHWKHWIGWENRNGSLRFTVEQNEYVYQTNSIFQHIVGHGGCKIFIRYKDGIEKVVYQSGASV